jgi:hypothetical protein
MECEVELRLPSVEKSRGDAKVVPPLKNLSAHVVTNTVLVKLSVDKVGVDKRDDAPS